MAFYGDKGFAALWIGFRKARAETAATTTKLAIVNSKNVASYLVRSCQKRQNTMNCESGWRARYISLSSRHSSPEIPGRVGVADKTTLTYLKIKYLIKFTCGILRFLLKLAATRASFSVRFFRFLSEVVEQNVSLFCKGCRTAISSNLSTKC